MMGFIDRINRRRFIKNTIIGLISFEFAYLFFDALKNKKLPKDGDGWFLLGSVQDFQKGSVYPFPSQKLYFSVFEDGSFLALSTKCPHLGCMIMATDHGYDCPCHSSSFNKRGEVLSSPANRPLDIFSIKFDKGQIFVDVTHPIKRHEFNKSQLTYV